MKRIAFKLVSVGTLSVALFAVSFLACDFASSGANNVPQRTSVVAATTCKARSASNGNHRPVFSKSEAHPSIVATSPLGYRSKRVSALFSKLNLHYYDCFVRVTIAPLSSGTRIAIYLAAGTRNAAENRKVLLRVVSRTRAFQIAP